MAGMVEPMIWRLVPLQQHELFGRQGGARHQAGHQVGYLDPAVFIVQLLSGF